MLGLFNFDDDDLGKIRRSINFFSLLLVAVWWSGAEINLTENGFITTSAPTSNFTLRLFCAVILGYLIVRQFFVARWYGDLAVEEMNRNSDRFRDTLENVRRSLINVEERIAERARHRLPDLQGAFAAIEGSQIIWARFMIVLEKEEKRLQVEDQGDPFLMDKMGGPTASPETRKKLQEVIARFYDLQRYPGSVLSDQGIDAAKKAGLLVEEYRKFMLDPEIRNAISAVKVAAPTISSALKTRAIDMNVFGIWFPRMLAISAIGLTFFMSPPA